MGLKVEDRGKVDENVVQIRIVVANDLQSIENVVHQAISLRNEILRGGDIITETTRTDNGTDKVSLIQSLVVFRTLADRLIDVDVSVLSEDGLNLELGKTVEFKLERKCGLAVSDTLIFLVRGASEGVVAWVDAIPTTDESHTTNTAGEQLFLVARDELADLGNNLSIFEVLNIADCNVQDSREFRRLGFRTRTRATLALQSGDKTVVAMLLLGEYFKGFKQVFLSIL